MEIKKRVMNYLIIRLFKKILDKIIEKMEGKMNRVAMRWLRVSVNVIIAGLAAQYGNSQWYLSLAPILSALGKYLREKYGPDYTWIPI